MEGRFTLTQVRAVRLGAVQVGLALGLVLGLAPLGSSPLLGDAALAQSSLAQSSSAQSLAQAPAQPPAPASDAAPIQINPAPPSVRRPDLELGRQGGTVAELQGVLKLLGFYLGDVNGLYDEATSLAVVRFQAAANLPQTGRVSTNTWNALFPLDGPSPTIATAPSPPRSAPSPQPTAPQSAPAAPASAPAASVPPQPAAPQPVTPQAPTPAPAVPRPAPAPAAAPQPETQPNPTPTLRLGEEGDAVVRLQRRLVEKGFLDGQADGDFGPMTEAAVKAAQEALGLEVDGIVGPATWRALLN